MDIKKNRRRSKSEENNNNNIDFNSIAVNHMKYSKSPYLPLWGNPLPAELSKLNLKSSSTGKSYHIYNNII